MFSLIHGRYHGSYRKNGKTDKEHANLNGFSGVDPPLLEGASSWDDVISRCERRIEEIEEERASLKRIVKAFEKAKKAGAEFIIDGERICR